jgi:hypothetical protein
VRRWIIVLTATVAVLGGIALASVLAWPSVGISGAGAGMARIALPGFAGRIEAVAVRTESGTGVPFRRIGGTLLPTELLPAGEPLLVTVTVRRPGIAGWLVGRTQTRTARVVTPEAHVAARWLTTRRGVPLHVRFDVPVSVVSIHGRRIELDPPRTAVALGVTGGAGQVRVSVAARPWERLSSPVRVAWFPRGAGAQALVQPRPGGGIAPRGTLTLTFSRPVAAVLGSARPQLSPATRGSWQLVDARTIAFRPSGLGFGLGQTIHVRLPRPLLVASRPARVITWHVPQGSPLRLQQLLAQLGYLPLTWQPAADPPSSARVELDEAIAPPPGSFSWRYPGTPAELRALWQPGRVDAITRAAVMAFESSHGLAVDGIAGPSVWRDLIFDVLGGRPSTGGYSYVFVHRTVPQSLNLWHNGKVVVASPGNTGVPAAPTQLGTWPVFEHISVGTMSGTNPDGSRYVDPGIRYISYFHGGDAIHAFPRGSYGTPQSLGCVELPLAAAAKVWPYTPIGTLVTIEN